MFVSPKIQFNFKKHSESYCVVEAHLQDGYLSLVSLSLIAIHFSAHVLSHGNHTYCLINLIQSDTNFGKHGLFKKEGWFLEFQLTTPDLWRDPCVAGPELWLRRTGYRRSYGDPCSGDQAPGGDTSPQYPPYCSNQCLARLLVTVLLYFLQVRHHEYEAAVVVLSWKYSLTYSLTLTRLSDAANLCGATIRCCTNAYGNKDAHYVTKETQTTDITSCPAGATHMA